MKVKINGVLSFLPVSYSLPQFIILLCIDDNLKCFVMYILLCGSEK